MTTLVGEHFSPWTEKARWALDHHGIAYTYREHVPLLGELLLRARARKLTGRVSVPLLIDDGERVAGSLEIARHAETIGSGEPLFGARSAEVAEWDARSEVALAAARARYLERVVRSRDAKIELQPSYFPLALRRASVPIAGAGIGFIRRKYGIDSATTAAAEASVVHELEALRAGLASGGGRHLIDDRLSYADITMAATLQFVAPVADAFVPLGPATRATCEDDVITARFPDLVAWRDTLYARFRARTV
jgi:glutathione S-transferase